MALRCFRSGRSNCWELDPALTTVVPSRRSGHSMAFDSARNQTVLFGGVTEDNEASNETWIWDGSNWSKRSPSSSPPPRSGQKMVYDSARGVIVLFGGNTGRFIGGSVTLGATFFNDTWTWDGATWTKRNPQTSPSARSIFYMAYDSARGQAVLYGGIKESFVAPDLDDTWTWDGSNWTKRTPANQPRYGGEGGAMAFDPVLNQVLLNKTPFRGDLGALYENETWSWDGSNWARKAPRTIQSIGNLPVAAVYDSIHREIVVYAVLSTWTWVRRAA